VGTANTQALVLHGCAVKSVHRTHLLFHDTRAPQGVEYAVQAALSLTLLLSGNWFCGAADLAVLGYMVHLWAGNRVLLDVTDVFRQLPAQKRQKLVLLGAHTALFMLVIYRCALG